MPWKSSQSASAIASRNCRTSSENASDAMGETAKVEVALVITLP